MFSMGFAGRTENLEKRSIDQESQVEKKTTSWLTESVRGQQVAFFIFTLAHCYRFIWDFFMDENVEVHLKYFIPSLLLELLISGTVCDTKLGDKMDFFMSKKSLIAWSIVQVTSLLGFLILFYQGKCSALILQIWCVIFIIAYPVFIITNIVRKLSPGQEYMATALLYATIPMLSSGVMRLS
ncbi:hypothetical protein KAFR_0G03840 [Kazachstania africana CBS 2517]|uniref:Uncharacterized protein n=1 Tax=Kazachstania africana (strain ATCC 22294 / BCRC 22015 / CBS 2517 / CECT 1963 / NBRC 1671 / NRRL Y-8276) TaxID=1071382 RepID=H2AYG7_KAZAF|nr:hypothetical protein KAFR_0G03840 [Kazachstania africana CBS 2517]CCF59417.1 hypothetical protein KAFR_0G03840 [Kazachstania africana CBS 2517]